MGSAEAAPILSPRLLGWREHVGLPELGLSGIQAKIDTGARTSSLHAVNIELFERDGADWARFRIDLGGGHATSTCEIRSVARRTITSSNGLGEKRLIVKTRLQIGDQNFRAEFSLADRSDMVFPILIGRSALRNRFVVDPAHSYLQSDKSGARNSCDENRDARPQSEPLFTPPDRRGG
ncbi:hypothetical protein FHS61_001821 [Altererythrobacter atlanticus]|uniref:Retropepsin-like aspartic endopeptidase domain-containing protein n=1 Tax=Croceibacterium atlanticum TaxID=1267766 RepID=A0A0F7KNX9_9SPHN|nr:ATP-dependent zinc protease [Croceibacterium atlanticum]AKH41294.1 hypothetical protein WYH_00230 [Croceibacterium atlanticum]MBB5732812.1 hypothetical protein [Croceibacterium atlanticum]